MTSFRRPGTGLEKGGSDVEKNKIGVTQPTSQEEKVISNYFEKLIKQGTVDTTDYKVSLSSVDKNRMHNIFSNPSNWTLQKVKGLVMSLLDNPEKNQTIYMLTSPIAEIGGREILSKAVKDQIAKDPNFINECKDTTSTLFTMMEEDEDFYLIDPEYIKKNSQRVKDYDKIISSPAGQTNILGLLHSILGEKIVRDNFLEDGKFINESKKTFNFLIENNRMLEARAIYDFLNRNNNLFNAESAITGLSQYLDNMKKKYISDLNKLETSKNPESFIRYYSFPFPPADSFVFEMFTTKSNEKFKGILNSESVKNKYFEYKEAQRRFNEYTDKILTYAARKEMQSYFFRDIFDEQNKLLRALNQSIIKDLGQQIEISKNNYLDFEALLKKYKDKIQNFSPEFYRILSQKLSDYETNRKS